MKENLPVILLFLAMFLSFGGIVGWGLFHLSKPMFPSEDKK